MEELMKFDKIKTFSSIYLCERVNFYRREEFKKELLHKSLLEKIRKEFEEEINEQEILPVVYKDQKGQDRPMFELTYEQSLQLLMSESKIVRKRVVEELKTIVDSHNRSNIPQTFSEALQLAANQAKQLELQAPKVNGYDKFIDAGGTQSFNEVAKILGTGRNKLMAKLREINILMKNNIPYQQYMDSGYFEVKENTSPSGINFSTTYVTPKGVEYLSNKINSN